MGTSVLSEEERPRRKCDISAEQRANYNHSDDDNDDNTLGIKGCWQIEFPANNFRIPRESRVTEEGWGGKSRGLII